jgi:hypothetical protein
MMKSRRKERMSNYKMPAFVVCAILLLASLPACSLGGHATQPPADLGDTIPPAADEPVSIVNITCLPDASIEITIHITHPEGITFYELWRTWGVPGGAQETFSAPLPTSIDKTVTIAGAVDSEPDRAHAWGLYVILLNNPEPVIVYGNEPNLRCPNP